MGSGASTGGKYRNKEVAKITRVLGSRRMSERLSKLLVGICRMNASLSDR